MSPSSKERLSPPPSQLPKTQSPGRASFSPPKARLVVASAAVVLISGLLFMRLVGLQIVDPEKYVEWGNSQRLRSYETVAARGDILDRNGQRFVFSEKKETIWADPQLISDTESIAGRLAPVLGLSQSELDTKLKSSGQFVYLKRKVSDSVAREVTALELPGIYTLTEYSRTTPGGQPLGLSVVGVVGGEEQGLSGIEFAYNDRLTGTNGRVVLEGDVGGQTVLPGKRRVEPAQRGENIILTIDKGLQFRAEQLISEALKSTGALNGSIMASNPKTGEILAMATAKSNIDEDGEQEIYISDDNYNITWTYEPGSAIKALTFSAVLDSGIAQPDTVRDVPDKYFLYGDEFTDHDPHPLKQWSVSDIVTVSSNIGTILWATDLGKTRLDTYLRRFGLGQSSKLGMPGESPGLLLKAKDYSGTSIATIPLGQGVSVTPMQLLYAFNAIANDGVYLPPRLILATSQGNSNSAKWVTHKQEGVSRRVVSSEAARQMREILGRVVSEGTGSNAAVQGFKVGGKTGTARKPLPGGGYEDAEGNFHYITTFAGFYPVEDPKISIIVVLDEPQNSIYASQTSAPVFADLASFAAGRFLIESEI